MKKLDEFNYFVTEDGRVLNASTLQERVQKLTKTGYKEVGLYNKEIKKWYRVHRLVAQMYIPNPENKPFVNHINGIKTDNRVENLEWVTHTENMVHASETGLCPRGEDNTNSKLTEKQVIEICELLQKGLRNKDITSLLNLQEHTVGMIRGKTCWSWISKNYSIPKKSRNLSIETLQWLKSKINEGLTRGEILKLANNPKINKHTIDDMRRGHYKDII